MSSLDMAIFSLISSKASSTRLFSLCRLLPSIAIIVFIYTGYDALTFALQSTAQSVMLATGVSLTTALVYAAGILLIKFAVVSYALKLILIKALQAVGGNEFLENVIKIVYVVVFTDKRA
jgi:hypothetical protein